MVSGEGYIVVQEPSNNSITIYLPQTTQGIWLRDVSARCDRKLFLSEDEEAVLLGIVKKLYEGEQNDN